MNRIIKISILLIVILIVVISLVIIIFIKDEKSRFIGTWMNEEADNPNYVNQLSFYSNNSMRSRITIDNETYYYWSNYEINDNYLCYSWTYLVEGQSGPFSDFFPEEGEEEQRVCMKYYFLDNDQKLKLDLGEGVSIIFVKV